jgi:hypothetical protein
VATGGFRPYHAEIQREVFVAEIKKQYPGKSADEIFQKVHGIMDGLAKKMDMKYESNASSKTGKVSKMGVTGSYAVKDGEVSIDLKFPMLIPGAMKQRVTEDIEKKLSSLFA